ncbi:hypothetical protein AM588_10002172 [Phytophthora nicotianae]|uniref:GOLD domain-containing protein n=1 Tax=Phytophthora nicotianae TaxID=4792 RepID=A0A0W8CYQ0_PHYNI|nr:hypothetical protein AM588_10002172 [Phytophthora nicotianae]
MVEEIRHDASANRLQMLRRKRLDVSRTREAKQRQKQRLITVAEAECDAVLLDVSKHDHNFHLFVTDTHTRAAARLQIRECLQTGGQTALETRDVRGNRALHLALKFAHRNSIAIVKSLLDAGARVRSRDTEGWKAIHHAVVSENEEIMRLLIRREVLVDPKSNHIVSLELAKDEEVTWKFSTEKRDINFGVRFLKENNGDEWNEIVPLQRTQAHLKEQTGSFKATSTGTLVVTWDNSYSVIRCDQLTLGWEKDKGVDDTRAPEGSRLSSMDRHGNRNCAWFTAYPPGYLALMKWVSAHDPSADVLLTENGWCGNAEADGAEDQMWYYTNYMEQVYKAVTEEKIKVIGYTAWSYLDNYEWGSFEPRFGLYYVNFTSQTGSKDYVSAKPTELERVPRPAAKWFSKLAKTKCIPTTSESAVVSAPSGVSSSEGLSTWSIVGIVVTAVVVVGAAVIGIRAYNNRRGSTSERRPLL